MLENARRKAAAVPGDLVLGVDTAVVLDGRAHGKPADRAEAEEVLRRLAGRDHEVLSAIALLRRPDRRGRHAGVVPRSSTRRCCPGTSTPANGATGPAVTRSRAGARRWWSASRATTSNVVGLPVATLLDLAPELLSS